MPQKVSDSPMMRQYREIKKVYPDALLFFRVGDFYELFYDDAKKGAQILELTLTSRSKNADEQIPMCGVPHHAIDKYLEELTDAGYKVAIGDQMEDPKSATGPTIKRAVTRLVTPGTYVKKEDAAFNNYLTSLILNQDKIGLAYADLSTGEIKYTEFNSLDSAIFEILGLNSKEVVVTNDDKEKVANLLKRSQILVSTADYQKQKISACKNALNLLNFYIEDTQMRSLSNLSHPKYYEAQEYLLIDYTSKLNLELTRSLREGKKYGSLFWAIDKTSTTMGSRKLRQWIERPLLDHQKIIERQEMVSELLDHYIVRSDLQDALKKVYDLEHICSKIAFGSVNARELTMLKTTLMLIPKIIDLLLNSDSQLLQNYSKNLNPLIDLSKMIDQAIKEDAPITITDGDLIKDGFSKELDEYRINLNGGKTWIAKMEASEKERTGINNLKVGYNKVFGYFIEVSKVNQDKVPKEYQRKQTLTNAERYITPELKEKENLILNARELSAKLEYELFVQIRDQVKAHLTDIQELANFISRLDCLNSLANDAEDHNYVRPKIIHDRTLDLRQSRHPVVELSTQLTTFIANDILMPENDEVMIITGPNMSGKSTYLRQLGLIVVLAQIGSFVPAQSATMPIFDRIFTRIGASDNLLSGESTFMVEMKEANYALQEATRNSLILMDEIGRGTATFDGMAIATAIINYLSDHVHAKTLFSTHYHELTQLADEKKNIFNKHVDATLKNGELIFVHKMLDGPSDRSYGVHVAKLAGLPASVIKDANKYLHKLEKVSVLPKKGAMSQENLFVDQGKSDEKELRSQNFIKKVKAIDLNSLTPLDALNFVADLQKELDLNDE